LPSSAWWNAYRSRSHPTSWSLSCLHLLTRTAARPAASPVIMLLASVDIIMLSAKCCGNLFWFSLLIQFEFLCTPEACQ
jgi:hypothetical protein